MAKIDDGGPVFPSGDYVGNDGLSRRDWFATFAPLPSEDAVKFHLEHDRAANPHGDSYKPSRRTVIEIIADLRFEYADAMIEAARKEPRK